MHEALIQALRFCASGEKLYLLPKLRRTDGWEGG